MSQFSSKRVASTVRLLSERVCSRGGEQVIFSLTGRTDGAMPSIQQLLKKPRKIGDSYSISLRVQGSV